MQKKNNYQKGSVNVSLVATMAIIAVVTVMLIFAALKYYKTSPAVVMTPNATPLTTLAPIRFAAIFNSEKIDIEKWHKCGESLECVSNLMKEENGSLEAINFTKLIYQENSGNLGFLEQFQEMGKIDLGKVAFPSRANTNEAYYLLNGYPGLVSTEIPGEEFAKAIEQDPLYFEMKNKYPDIGLWTALAQFSEKKILSNDNERFIFTYEFKNGCHACTTEYSASIGFDFNSSGQFLKTTFLQIVVAASKPLPTSSLGETADWQTYANKEYGFEIKYPKDWKSAENSGTDFSQPRLSIASPDTLKAIENEKARFNGDYVTSIHDIAISYYPSVEEMPFNKSNKYGAKTIDELIGNKNASLTKIGELEIDGVKAVAVIQHGESRYYTVFIEKDKHLYEIFFDVKIWIWDGKKLTAVAKRILSTFEFIK